MQLKPVTNTAGKQMKRSTYSQKNTGSATTKKPGAI
jgi:hypothetical protein